jgi:hypothetical protein
MESGGSDEAGVENWGKYNLASGPLLAGAHKLLVSLVQQR